jgi:hypothetical protein
MSKGVGSPSPDEQAVQIPNSPSRRTGIAAERDLQRIGIEPNERHLKVAERWRRVALALAPEAPAAQQKLKVGFIYVGPVGDHGWSYQHDVGRKAIEKEFGNRVETTFVESVPEADSERAIEQLARTGHGLIFTTSFGFMEPTSRSRGSTRT